MEYTLKKIISIDKEAENFRMSKVNELKEKKEELQNEIKKLWADLSEDIETMKKNINIETTNKAYEEIEILKKNKEEEIENLKKKYEQAKQDILEEAFINILSFSKEK